MVRFILFRKVGLSTSGLFRLQYRNLSIKEDSFISRASFCHFWVKITSENLVLELSKRRTMILFFLLYVNRVSGLHLTRHKSSNSSVVRTSDWWTENWPLNLSP